MSEQIEINPETVSINVIIQSDFLDGPNFKEAIDLALVCAAFEQRVALIFVEQGVNNLSVRRDTALVGCKNQADIVKGLEFYDIQDVYVEQESLDRRSLATEDILTNIKRATKVEINQMNIDADKVVII